MDLLLDINPLIYIQSTRQLRLWSAYTLYPQPNGSAAGNGSTPHITSSPNLVPGPPFVFGALLVICALMVAAFIPEGSAKSRKQSGMY